MPEIFRDTEPAAKVFGIESRLLVFVGTSKDN